MNNEITITLTGQSAENYVSFKKIMQEGEKLYIHNEHACLLFKTPHSFYSGNFLYYMRFISKDEKTSILLEEIETIRQENERLSEKIMELNAKLELAEPEKKSFFAKIFSK